VTDPSTHASSFVESSSEEDLEGFFTDEEWAEEEEGEKKPPPTRLIVEHESLKRCMERNCRCIKCDGQVEMKVKTLCLASNVMVKCLDKECGYIDVSDLPPATANVGAKTKTDRERSTDFAINVLYVLGFMSCGDGPTESGRPRSSAYWVFQMTQQCRQGPLVSLKRG
jgi:hypothetical protein